ncbi:MAG: type IV pilus assembly protein PilM, partial [Candidatus Saccharimonadales bacterium]
MGLFNFYHDEPLFGLDIGHSSLKVMQFETVKGKAPRVAGYGYNNYPAGAIANGVIVKPETIARSLHELISGHLVGSISTNKIACSLPTARTFSRPMRLPAMDESDIREAIHLEAEHYIPIPIANLYIDYEISRQGPDGIDILMVAAPRNMVDSYVRLLQSLELDPVALEPAINASSRLFKLADPSHNQPSLLIDFGSVATDIAVFDQTMFVNSTVAGGGDTMTGLIAKALSMEMGEAGEIKSKYGLSYSAKQPEILTAIQPMLDALIREVRKIMRYYNERAGKGGRKLVQIITIGGGATMPGLSQYLTKQLDLPAKLLDPWQQLDFGPLPSPAPIDQSMYITVAGEAI